MAAIMGIATQNIGESAGETLFLVVSDGSTTKFLLPADLRDEDKTDLLIALGSRLTAIDSNDPEQIVDAMVYNMPADMSATEPMESLDDAIRSAQDYMALVDDFDPETSPLLDAITTRDEEETNG